MSTKKPPRRPSRGTTPLLPAQAGLYRAGLHAELQKFGSARRDQQMAIFAETRGDTRPPDVLDLTGLDLSICEDKALSALQILLDNTGYGGNTKGEMAYSDSYKGEFFVPRLLITQTEFFEAYGLERKANGRFPSRQSEEALSALESLAKTRRICYARRRYEGEGQKRRQVSDVIVFTGPICSVSKVYFGLSPEEERRVEAGEHLSRRVNRLLIDFSPLLIDQIRSFYLLKPSTLHHEIGKILGKRRVSRTVSLFIEWLLTKNTPVVRASRDVLIERLRLRDLYVRQRQKKRVLDQLAEAYDVAVQLDFLQSYEETEEGMMRFTLNPTRCPRVKGGGESDERELVLTLEDSAAGAESPTD
jgi:hypothetical protein